MARLTPVAKVKREIRRIFDKGDRKLQEAKTALAKRSVELVISPNEISFDHGTGVLLARILEDKSNLVTIRAASHYGGKQAVNSLAQYSLPDAGGSREEIFAQVQEWIRPYNITSILYVPYFPEDVLIALAASYITKAPLVMWIMDDNCLVRRGISEADMAEIIARANAVFAISPELRAAYGSRFRKRVEVLPPLVVDRLIPQQASRPPESGNGIILGNIWVSDWLDRLRAVTRNSGIGLTWYAPGGEASRWLKATSGELERDGIILRESPEAEELIPIVAAAPFVLVPTDPGDENEHGNALAEFSLPTRAVFTTVTTGTPLISVGSQTSALANFINGFKLGRAVPYDAQQLRLAIEEVSEPNEQLKIRVAAAKLGPAFSVSVGRELISRAFGRYRGPATNPFDKLFRNAGPRFSYYVDPPVPEHVVPDFRDVYRFCSRLARNGWNPDFVIDVGASTGIWSRTVSEIFPKARFLLCDPLFSRYAHKTVSPGFKLVESAIGDREGHIDITVSSNLYGSSVLHVDEFAEKAETITVPMTTVDKVFAEQRLSGRGLLKADVQFAEHLVIAGAEQTLANNVDFVILELTLTRPHPQTRTLLEMCNRMDEVGFEPYDLAGDWRAPRTGALEQLDVVFIRKGIRGALEEDAGLDEKSTSCERS